MAVKTLGPESPLIAGARSSLGRTLLAQGETKEARALLSDSYPVLVQSHGEDAVAAVQTKAALEQLERMAQSTD
jgi:hypothetical protein